MRLVTGVVFLAILVMIFLISRQNANLDAELKQMELDAEAEMVDDSTPAPAPVVSAPVPAPAPAPVVSAPAPDPAPAPVVSAPAPDPAPAPTGGFTTVQLCSPWKARECERAGAELTCEEFTACRLKYNQWSCAGEKYYEKCK